MRSLRVASLIVLGAACLSLNPALCQDSLNVTRVGQYAYWSDASDVEVVGELVYVATGTTGLHIVDVSDPTSPRDIGYLDTPGQAMDVAVAENFAYVADNDSGLRVINISNPVAPFEVASLSIGESGIETVAIMGNLILANNSWWSGNFYVIDVSDPANPFLISETTFGSSAYDLLARDSLIYVADFYNGLRIIDVHDPANPVQLSALDSVRGARDLALSGNYVFTASGERGLFVVDVSVPDSPAVVFNTGYGWSGPNYSAVDVTGTLLVASTGEGVYTFDISIPSQPVGLDTLSGSYCFNGGDIAAMPNRAYEATSCGALYVLDTGNPSNVMQLGVYDTPTSCGEVAVSGSYAFLGGYLDIGVSDVSNPSQPVMASIISDSYYFPVVEVHGQYAYVGLTWADGPMDDVSGLHIYDISDPLILVEVGETYMPETIRAMAYAGGYIYAAGEWPNGVHIVDVSDPTAPVEVGLLTAPNPYAITIVDTLLIFGPYNSGIVIADISNPIAPVQLSSALDEHSIRDVAASGTHVYALCDTSLFVVDISNPSIPVVIGSHCVTDGVSLEVDGDRVYVAERQQGFCVLDVSNPSVPMEIGFYNTPGRAYEIDVQDSLIYVADEYYFGVYRVTPTTSVPRHGQPEIPRKLALSAYPNPFNGETTISYELPRRTEIELAIYNLLGEKVAVLAQGIEEPGVHGSRWQPQVSSGIYFARLTPLDPPATQGEMSRGSAVMQKVVYLK